ncbi:MAG: bifunctional folylpolyglutamate synthase/dihydrofolate synthase [Candidatus ainarchaeum sp.]|nr:bifunctional folylpolyglutamate synthase/dihydrofolate synthase [Candidatus ainarchaeum sp.]
MNYEEAINYLYSLNVHGGRLGLARERRLLRALGNPQEKMKVILVGGTNGKGSTAAMIASMLQASGFKTGRFTKPHLSRFTERISMNGREIGEQELARLASLVWKEAGKLKGGKPTFFEVTVAIAYSYFADKKADFAVMEVGLGGRLDATNTANAIVSVITNVSLEHTEILGKTIEKIAFEKAGIIKRRGVIVTSAEGPALRVILREAEKKRAQVLVLGRHFKITKPVRIQGGQRFSYSGLDASQRTFRLPLLGAHQLKNAACALACVESIFPDSHVPEEAMRKGLAEVSWPGRLELVQKNPYVVLDCAKDLDAVKTVLRELRKVFRYERLIAVVSISSDKNFREMMRSIARAANVTIVTKHGVLSRAIETKVLAREALRNCKFVLEVQRVRDAVARALELAGRRDLVLVIGSVFAVGEARELWFPSSRMERNLNEVPKK